MQEFKIDIKCCEDDKYSLIFEVAIQSKNDTKSDTNSCT